ncbi:MAG TPA: hypothetical protein VHH10_13300 [Rubrobacteraceae bacterium]|jgi:hypothetical protein|nr:hypothetical protein [Rubrobacteraceae bacterium]
MVGKLLGRDEVYAALVLALSGYAMLAVARGEGPLARENVVARVLPDPVAGVAAGIHRSSTVTAPRREVARGAA